MQTELMSELDAVNKILAATGDSPVATLDDSYIQSKLAQQELQRASRDVQIKGWWFNEEENVSLNPDVNGFITLAPNVLKVSAVGDGATIIQRGNKLYDRGNRTYVFTEAVTADIIIGLTWNELPQAARAYITDMAAVKFNNSFYGAEDTKRILEANLAMSELDLRHADTDARDINLLTQTRVRNIAFKNRRG
jgi:hypothetical protein